MSILDTASSLFKSIIGGGNFPTTYVTSTIDGKSYKVRDMPDKQQAANMMATLRTKLVKLCEALEKKYPDKPQVKQMVRNFRADPERFMEATPDSEHTSSTVNKGESIHMCLRQRDGPDESLVDENVMVFVALFLKLFRGYRYMVEQRIKIERKLYWNGTIGVIETSYTVLCICCFC